MEPDTEGRRPMSPIAMLEPQYQMAAFVIVAKDRTGAVPGWRVTDARPADAIAAIATLIELEGVAASPADGRRYEGDFHPACGAKRTFGADDGTAFKALMRKQQIDNRIQRAAGG